MAGTKRQSATGLRATGGHKTLSFGLVNVNVGLAPMYETVKRTSANLICPDDHAKLVQKYQCPECGQLHGRADCEKGYPVEGGYVVFDQSELDALKVESEDAVALECKVPLASVPREWVDTSYLIFPDTPKDVEGYALIAAMLRDSDEALIGTVNDKGTTKAYAITWSPATEILVAHVLHYEGNLRHAHVEAVQDALAKAGEPSKEMLAMAEALFGTMPSEFDPSEVEDEYEVRLQAAIAAKAAGKTVEAPAAQEAPEPETDLLAALKASMAEVEAAKVA